MEKRFKVADFARLIGCGAKTVYRLKEDKKLKSDKEIINGREIDIIIATDDKIEELQRQYSKKYDNIGKYCDNVTENDIYCNDNYGQNPEKSITQSEIIEKIMTFSKETNEMIMDINDKNIKEIQRLSEELVQYKSRIPLLEDKAQREGVYLQEISDLKTENEKIKTENEKKLSRQNKIFSVIVLILSLLLLTVTGILLYNLSTFSYNIKQNMTKTENEIKNTIETIEK